jgi:hypothetical protein
MTEQEWLECTNPDNMLYYLQRSVSARKYRLFAVACCRRVWHLIADERSRRLVETVERHIEKQASEDEWKEASAGAHQAWLGSSAKFAPSLYGLPHEPLTPEQAAAIHALHSTTSAGRELGYEAFRKQPGHEGRGVAHAVARETARAVQEDYGGSPERPRQCDILRDIVGNAFRRTRIAPAILEWSDKTVPKLAKAIYDDRAYDLLPVLADALEEAGCDNADLLSHLRSPGPHVRGCWALDLILGRE